MDALVCPVCKTVMGSVQDLDLLFKTAKWKNIRCHCICGEVHQIFASKEDLRVMSAISCGGSPMKPDKKKTNEV